MPTSTASLSLSRPGSSKNSAGQSTASPAPPWRRMSRQDSRTSQQPAPPPPPPPPPAMEPPPPPPPPPIEKKKEIPGHVLVKLEQYKKTPRKRPDWASMMKEIEVGKQLRRVETNDRSRPILPKAKAKGKVLPGQTFTPITCSDDTSIDANTKEVFVYDSEKPTVANQILLEIQKGVRLKKTRCNDRSRPNLNGLGVFRRQLSTVETDPAEPTTPIIEQDDDYDDIDKVRDDLQSTKQLLEIELKNRRKIDEENAKLQSEIQRLKEELSKKPNQASHPTTRRSSSTNQFADANSILKKSTSRMAVKKPKKDSSDEEESDEDSDEEEEDFGELDAVEEELNNLKGQAELARKSAEEFETRYKETAKQLVTTQAEMEDLEMKVAVLKKKLRRAAQNSGEEIEDIETCTVACQTDPIEPPPVESRPARSHSKRDLRKQMSRQDSRGSNVSSANNQAAGEEESDEDEEEEEVEDVDALYLKSQKRELALLASRLRSTKDKEKNVRNERIALHIQLKKFRNDLKEEKKKYSGLKQEVDGMAVLMNEVGDDEKVEFVVEEVEVTDSEGEEEDEEEEVEEEEDIDDLDEMEEEESDEDTESDEIETRIDKLNDRLSNHDNTLSTLKKGNYLLKSKVDIAQEELRRERSRYSALEIELNNCLAELG